MPAKKSTAMKTARKAAPKAAPASGGSAADRRYFAEQTPEKRALLVKLRAVVMKAVPGATVSIKWGVPFYSKDSKDICALASFKDNVAINFFASPGLLIDPRKRLEGGGKKNRMLKVRTAADIDSASITRWLKAAVSAA